MWENGNPRGLGLRVAGSIPAILIYLPPDVDFHQLVQVSFPGD